MATRTIVTSQPDVACDVCERRLLRGEQPDTFLAAGRRRTVCELCAPRAAHEGWLRETDGQSLTLPPMRPRRGRSFFERLRQVGRPPGGEAAASSPGERAPERDGYDLLDRFEPSGSGRAGGRGRPAPPAEARPRTGEGSVETGSAAYGGEVPGEGSDGTVVDPEASYLLHALALFNASEYPRRIAGVARSLGTPVVSVLSAEHLSSVVRIVVAWELSWYRYEADLSEEPPRVRAIAQGTELGELAREDRVGNALADERGALSLSTS